MYTHSIFSNQLRWVLRLKTGNQVQVLWGLAACCTETFSFFGIDVCNNLGPLWAKVFTKLNKRFVFKWHESTTWIANLDARVYIHLHIQPNNFIWTSHGCKKNLQRHVSCLCKSCGSAAVSKISSGIGCKPQSTGANAKQGEVETFACAVLDTYFEYVRGTKV